MPSQIVTAWWQYNPIYQKPTVLEPVQPYSWYWYYGPDPAAGVSYGQYEDLDHKFQLVTQKGDKVFSPVTGKEMKFISDVPQNEVKAVLALSTSGKGTREKVSCSSCKADLVSTVSTASAKVVHCCCCGDKVKAEKSETTTALSNERTEIMAIEKDRLARVKEIRSRVKANLLKEESKVVEASEDEWVSLDQIQQALAEVEAEEAKKEKEEAKPAEDLATSESDEGEVSLDELMEAITAVGEEESQEAEAAEEEAEEPAESAEEPKAEDEYMDLDMVLSALNKKESLRKKAEARKRAEAKTRWLERRRKIKAEEEKAEEDAEEAEEASEEVEGDEVKVENVDNPPPVPVMEEAVEPEESVAMKFEPLASVDSLKRVKKDQIDMSLFGENSENPTWHVTVAGVPTARIQLKVQASADDIRDVFVSEDYALSLVDHCDKSGFVETMNKVNAEFWANHVSNKTIAARFEQAAEKKYANEYKKVLAVFRSDFLNCLNIVNAGLNKNFYPEIGNPLKGSLFANLTMVGLPEQTATSAIEKAFSEGASDYFHSLFDKSEEYMDMNPVARSEVAKAITRATTISMADDSLARAEPATLAERLDRASRVSASVANTSGFQVREPLSIDAEEYKRQVRSAWRGRK